MWKWNIQRFLRGLSQPFWGFYCCCKLCSQSVLSWCFLAFSRSFHFGISCCALGNLEVCCAQAVNSTQDMVKDRLDSTTFVALHNSHCWNWKWDWRMTHAFPHPTSAMNLWPSSSVIRNNDKKGSDLVRQCNLTLQTAHIRWGWEGLRCVILTSGFCYFICQTWGEGCWYELNRKW